MSVYSIKSFLLPRKPDFALYYQLLILNVNGTAIALGFMLLWRWEVGWLFIVFLMTLVLIFATAHRATDAALSQIEKQRDLAELQSNYLKSAIAVITDVSVDEEHCSCRYCGSKHRGLLTPSRFHPQLHNRRCQIPVLRSKIEQIDLDLPDFDDLEPVENDTNSETE
jgi:hypothetical protein